MGSAAPPFPAVPTADAASHRPDRFTVVPVSLRDANTYVERHHRHARPVQGAKFSLGARQAGRLVGVAIVGRPVARALDDTATLEVRRLCTAGDRNACSFLLGAARHAAKALGYTRLVTYTLATEPGSSLRAAGWEQTGTVTARSWHCLSRPRTDRHPLAARRRWEVRC